MKPKDQLIWGAIANAKNTEFNPRPLWAVARDIFGCGSTTAENLCIEHRFDPDKEMPPIVCPTCEMDLIYLWGTEDDQIILNKDERWHETLYASCPEQAKSFFKAYEHVKYPTTQEWIETLFQFQTGWQCDQENYV